MEYAEYVEKNKVELYKYAEDTFFKLLLKREYFDEEYYDKLKLWVDDNYSHKKKFLYEYLIRNKGFDPKLQLTHCLFIDSIDFTPSNYKDFSKIAIALDNETNLNYLHSDFDLEEFNGTVKTLQPLLPSKTLGRIALYIHHYFLYQTESIEGVDTELFSHYKVDFPTRRKRISKILREAKKRLKATKV